MKKAINILSALLVISSMIAFAGSPSSAGKKDATTIPQTDNHIKIAKLIQVYPNPNRGEFTLTLPKFEGSANLIMIDLTGREVLKRNLAQGENDIDDARITAGEYMLRININGTLSSKMIIVKPET